MRKLEEGKKDIPCVECDDADKRIPLWDELEELFADPATKQRVQDLRDEVAIVLDTTSKERVLVGDWRTEPTAVRRLRDCLPASLPCRTVC